MSAYSVLVFMKPKYTESPLIQLFSDRLRTERKRQGISQEALARIVGLHRTYVGSVERCERNISLLNVEKFAQALDIPVISLLTDDNK